MDIFVIFAVKSEDNRPIFIMKITDNIIIYECDNYEEFKERVKDGGFFLCHWDGTAETEAKIKEETQATIRCVPFAYEQTPGVDMVSGKPAVARVIIARSY
jgi:prolyl-tRNA synthetase